MRREPAVHASHAPSGEKNGDRRKIDGRHAAGAELAFHAIATGEIGGQSQESVGAWRRRSVGHACEYAATAAAFKVAKLLRSIGQRDAGA
jgi:hypothetical protein